MKRTHTWLAGACSGLILLSACTSSSKPAAKPTTPVPTTSSATRTVSVTPLKPPVVAKPKPKPKPKPRPVDPLSGLPVKAVARRPIVVVKVENSVAARPQTGLNAADIVVEELVEGGITRFAAMFHTNVPPSDIGPVRSLRDVDREIAGPTRGLLVSSGGAGVVRKRLRRGSAQLVLPTSAGGYYRRSGARVAPHNLYVNGRAVMRVAYGPHRKPPTTTYLPFSKTVGGSTAVRQGKRTTRISLYFSPSANPRWAYDPHTRNWLRSEGQTPSRLTNGKRMTARTILVIRVHTRDAGYRDPAGNYVPQTVFVGRGNAMVFCQGRRVEAQWTKKSPTAPLRLVTRKGGKPVLIAPGRTWIEMLTTGGTMRMS